MAAHHVTGIIFALLALPVLTGCGGPRYVADRTGGVAESQVVTLQVEPTVRLVSVNGEPVDEVPAVGVRDMRRDRGTNARTILLPPGRHTAVAGFGPLFFTNVRQYGGGGGVGAGIGFGGGGTSLSVGGGSAGGGTRAASFRYPGATFDQRIEFDLEAGRTYVLRVAGEDEPASDGWRVEVAPGRAKPNRRPGTATRAVSRVVGTEPSQFPETAPLRDYFPKVADGANFY